MTVYQRLGHTFCIECPQTTVVDAHAVPFMAQIRVRETQKTPLGPELKSVEYSANFIVVLQPQLA